MLDDNEEQDMYSNIIKSHKFETAKSNIKKFSELRTTDLDLKHVAEKKDAEEWLRDFVLRGMHGTDHIVNGEELNELTSQIQSLFINVNNTQTRLIEEFGEVYDALEFLDKDYIQAILVSIKATEETSRLIGTTQEQIKRIVEDQRKTLEVLKRFTQRLESYDHLKDIDKLWNDCQNWSEEVGMLCSVSKQHSYQIEELQNQSKEAEHLIRNNKEIVDQLVSADGENTGAIMQKLNKKMQYIYWIAGGSMALALIELFVFMAR